MIANNTHFTTVDDFQKYLEEKNNELRKENERLEKFSKEILAREESLNLAQEIGHFGSWEVNLKTGNSLFSKESHRMYKLDFDGANSTLETFIERVIDEDKPIVLKALHESTDGKIKSIELRVRRADDVVIHVLLNGKMIFDDDGLPSKIIGTTFDITELVVTKRELKEKTKQLDFQVYHDHLTKLPNRTLFNDRLEQSIANSSRTDQILAVLFIDLDNFKQINDTLGHNIGDKVLQLISKRLSTCIRLDDSLSRLGGDEFTVIIHNLKTPESAADVAQKILDIINSKLIVDNNELYLSASIGISVYPKDSSNANDLLKFADSAMYKAKEKDKNNYQFYSSDMTQLAFEKVLMQTSLHTAIMKKEFIVYYQPQINAKNNTVIGMEALVRWQHPTMGIVSPAKFIPIAEESGFIITLDNFVMKQAMSDFVNWYNKGLNPGTLSLNLSIKQLNNDYFINFLKHTIKETGFNIQWLEFEITETQMMQDPLSSIEKLNTISSMGITIAIDDFGTGYSSLTYLKRLPVDKLKIDKSFIDEIPHDEEDCTISKAIIALARSLNLKIIAEGVEHKEQKEFLLEHGCELIQGYYYSRPLPKDEAEIYLKMPIV
ncbi:EAL domain-containing protein [bacterium]|nr:EAL domain-containing protein [bacterium]MBU1884131.1 EAL domain-containing protein [bacterium]